MKTFFTLLFIFSAFLMNAQRLEVMNYEQLEQRLNTESDTVYLVNFWATWCRPCVEELPDFLKLNEELKNENFKLILVSLDFSNQIEKRVKPFIKSRSIDAEVIVLDDPDANTWISKVDESWDGAIPVSLIIHQNKKEFYGSTLTYEELKKIVNPKIKH